MEHLVVEPLLLFLVRFYSIIILIILPLIYFVFWCTFLFGFLARQKRDKVSDYRVVRETEHVHSFSVHYLQFSTLNLSADLVAVYGKNKMTGVVQLFAGNAFFIPSKLILELKSFKNLHTSIGSMCF